MKKIVLFQRSTAEIPTTNELNLSLRDLASLASNKMMSSTSETTKPKSKKVLLVIECQSALNWYKFFPAGSCLSDGTPIQVEQAEWDDISIVSYADSGAHQFLIQRCFSFGSCARLVACPPNARPPYSNLWKLYFICYLSSFLLSSVRPSHLCSTTTPL